MTTIPTASQDDDFADFEDAFFKSYEESNAAVEEGCDSPVEADGPDHGEALSEDHLVRRRRLRKVVRVVVGALGATAVLVIVRFQTGSTTSHDVRRLEGPPALMGAAAPPLAVGRIVSDDRLTGEPRVQPSRDDSNQVAPAPPAVTAQPETPINAAQFKRRARLAVVSGRFRDGIGLSQEAIHADPGDAEAYLLLGFALQETGQAKAAADVFTECTRRAGRGPKGECRALAPR